MHLLYMWLGFSRFDFKFLAALQMFGQVALKDIDKTCGRRHNEKQ